MEKTKVVTIGEFCEEFGGYAEDAEVFIGIYGYQDGAAESHRSTDLKMSCQKQDISFYEVNNAPDMMRMYVDSNDYNGTFFGIKECKRKEHDISVGFEFFDKKGRIIFWVEVFQL